MSFLTGQLVKNILNLGVLMPPRPALNFLGSGWVLTDNPGNNSTDITFGGGSSLPGEFFFDRSDGKPFALLAPQNLDQTQVTGDLWLGVDNCSTPSSTNYAISSGNGVTTVNAPAGGTVQLAIDNIDYGGIWQAVSPAGWVFSGSFNLFSVSTVSATSYSTDTGGVVSQGVPFGDLSVLTDSTSNAISVRLPTPTTGRLMIVCDSTGQAATHNVTIHPFSTEKINGASTYTLTLARASVMLLSDGFNWFVVGSYNGTVI